MANGERERSIEESRELFKKLEDRTKSPLELSEEERKYFLDGIVKAASLGYGFDIDENGRPVLDQRKLIETSARGLAYKILSQDLTEIPNFPKLPPTKENTFWANIHNMHQELQKRGNGYTETFVKNWSKEVRDAAEFVRTRKAYSYLDSLSKTKSILIPGEAISTDPRTIYWDTFDTIYSLVCGPERFLVCAKSHPTWRKINLQENTREELGRQWNMIWLHIAPRLHELERDIEVIIPDYFIFSEDLINLSFPEPPRAIEESLEEAYYRKHYIIPPEGALVHIRNGGDLEGFTLTERNNVLWSKARTGSGDYLLRLDLSEGTLDVNQHYLSVEELDAAQKLGKILAEVYRDMVISIDVLKPVRPRISGEPKPPREKPPQQFEWTYIPRVRKIPVSISDRVRPTETQREPPRPHRVSGFKRRGNITERHRREIKRFEMETGISVLDNLPDGYTFVRPHVKPKDSLSSLSGLPKFLKRKIEQELRGPVKVQI